ncbi:protein FAM107B isoform X2 [Clupea harengus]|uniref:Actin-associated protein FAM107A n=1 Tax=Clupea harengus TaxID=7950 RepID=A0A6P3WES0_CLUHA|nr:protein FAM107B isoform X2 [Clupea harengus]
MAQRVTHSHSLFPEGQPGRPREVLVKSASAYADLQWESPQPEPAQRDPCGYPRRDLPPVASYAAQPDYMEEDDDLIKPKKLVNPVKASKSHQELHRELLLNQKRGVETKPELQRVLEQRKREQMIKQRKQEEEARKKVSPLEQELLKRRRELEELEREQEEQQEAGSKNAPEFIKVKENLRRTSFLNTEEKEV